MSSSTRVVDVHTHAIPAGFVDLVRREGERYGYRVEGSGHGVTSVVIADGARLELTPRWTDERLRLEDLAAAGIDTALESVTPRAMVYAADERAAEWGARAVNDAFAENMRAFPDRLIGVAHVPLQFPAIAVRELRRVVNEHGMRSVQIATHVRGADLDAPELRPFWAAAADLGVLVLVHPQQEAARHRFDRYHLRNLIANPLETTIAAAHLIFGGVLEGSPALNVCLAHAGGYTPWIRGRWRHGHRVRPESRELMHESFETSFGRLYFDTVVHDARALRYLVESCGADRILHGTDYAADMGDLSQVSAIRSSEWLTPEDKAKILGGNAGRLLGF